MNDTLITSPIKAIRAKCLDCCCNQNTEVKLCTATNCPLYPFRFGKNPYYKRTLTDEQKAEMAQRLLNVRRQNSNT